MSRLLKRAGVTVFAVAGFGVAAIGVASGGSTASAVEASRGGTTAVAKSAETQPRAVVDVTFDEWRIEAGEGPVRAGRVTFEEHNAGAVDHDLMIVRTDRAPDALPMGLEGVSPELAGDVVLGESHTGHDHGGGRSHAGVHSGSDRHVQPGGQRRRTLTLEPGRYVLLCPVPGHYERGQAAAVTVKGAAGPTVRDPRTSLTSAGRGPSS